MLYEIKQCIVFFGTPGIYLIPKAVCNHCLNILENALATLKLNYI